METCQGKIVRIILAPSIDRGDVINCELHILPELRGVAVLT